jgi:hypothetical protein
VGSHPLAGAAVIDYRGSRYVLGRTSDGYAIWDRSVGGPPLRLFPLTVEGWAEAWSAFQDLEAAGRAPGAIPPLGIGRIIGVAFAVYRRHLRVLAAIAGAIVLPFYALSLTLILATVRLVPERVGLQVVPTPRIPAWVDVVNNVALYVFVIPFLTGAMVTAVAWAMLDRRPTLRGAYLRAARRAHSVLWVSFLAGIAGAAPLVPGIVVAAGGSTVPLAAALLALGLVPAVFLGIRFLFGTSVVIVESARGTEALRRSWRLVRGSTGKVLGGLLLALLVFLGVLLVVVTLALTVVLFREITEETVRLVLVVVSVVTALIVTLVGPFVNVVIVLLYLDARGRKDGLDLQRLAAEIDGEA